MKTKHFIFLFSILLTRIGAEAQTLSVAPIEGLAGSQTDLVVNISGATSMTSLQFNLELPEGLSFTNTSSRHGATLGSAADGYTLSVSTLDSGDLMLVFFSLDGDTFGEGELLRIPVTIASDATNSEGRLYTVRMSSTEAVTTTLPDVPVNLVVKKGFNLTVGSAGMATLYLDYAVSIPENATVSYVSSREGDDLILTNLDGNIPAYTGVIVTADQGSYTFMETSETVDAINGNMLSGSTTEIETSNITNGTVYTLGHGTNDELGFFRYKGATLGAYKAFLVVANSEVNAFSLVFSNDDASAVIGIEDCEKNTVVYDLQGRRAERPNKGIYIVNGKKVLFK